MLKKSISLLLIVLSSFLLNGCLTMCVIDIAITPKNTYQTTKLPNAQVNLAYSEVVELGYFRSMYKYHQTDDSQVPDGMKIEYLLKDLDDQWVEIENQQDWKVVMNRDDQVITGIRLVGTPQKAGQYSINIQSYSYRTMCGTSDIIYSLKLKVTK